MRPLSSWHRCSTGGTPAPELARRPRWPRRTTPSSSPWTRTKTENPMLFDLRGRGRRNTVKAVYITLAFLMGGGLVLFGIGGGGAISGGLVDAITGSHGGGDTGTDRFRKAEETAVQ